MRNWLLAFRPDTYEKVQQHGTIGVLKHHRKRFADLAKGDRFIVYLTQVQCLDGHGLIDGSPFEDTKPIFGEGQNYPNRCRVKFLETGVRRPVGDSLWFLDVFRELNNTVPTNMLFCRGGFIEIPGSDYDYLRGILGGAEVGGSLHLA
ncbi:MAG: hypothetical protein AMXMBFR33_17660 [Candidatus Xenobia bacterium]